MSTDYVYPFIPLVVLPLKSIHRSSAPNNFGLSIFGDDLEIPRGWYVPKRTTLAEKPTCARGGYAKEPGLLMIVERLLKLRDVRRRRINWITVGCRHHRCDLS